MPESIDGTLDLLVILDRSGSMQDAKSDHEGGLKSFVEDQRDLAGDVRLTLVQFDTEAPCEVVYDRVPLADVGEIRLIPRGGTPLLDAIGKAVSHLRAQLTDAATVVAMVITDGDENSSREWTRSRVKALVTELESKGWNFLFLGANIDAFAEAGSLGVPMAASASFANHQPQAVSAMYASTMSNVSRSRGLRAAGATRQAVTASLSYTSDQRAAMAGTDPFANGTAGTAVPSDQAGDNSVVNFTTTTNGE